MRIPPYVLERMSGVAAVGGILTIYFGVFGTLNCSRSQKNPDVSNPPQISQLEVVADAGAYQPSPEQQHALEALCKLGINWPDITGRENPCAQNKNYGNSADHREVFCSAMRKWEIRVGDSIGPERQNYFGVQKNAKGLGIFCEQEQF